MGKNEMKSMITDFILQILNGGISAKHIKYLNIP